MKLIERAGNIITFIILILFSSVLAGHAMPTQYPVSTTILNSNKAYKGNILYRAVIEGTSKVLLMDMRGNILHTWVLPEYKGVGYPEPLGNGNILALARRNNNTYVLVELDWDGNIVWEYYYPNAISHHDVERLDNGNTLILYREDRNVPGISSKDLLDDFIAEVNAEGDIVWEWHTYEHFDEFGFSDTAKQQIYDAGGDWAHTNSIQSLPPNTLNDPRFSEGNILVSQRETNIIFVIDKETGQIVWKIGPDDNLTIAQHDARMIRKGFEGAGNILVFDNGGDAGYPSQFRFYSKVIEIEPIFKKVVFLYTAKRSNLPLSTFFSYSMGGSQKLPNGNILINEAETGRFFQVTPDGEIVWEYINPFFKQEPEFLTNQVYRIWMINRNWPPAI
ncbi:MAG TPA: hypothetical protein ENG75_05185 [Nitrospirae bacterium]|nr:hypothetical protein [Nitrospirota bacterium]